MIVCTFAAENDNCYKLMKNLLSSQFRALIAIIIFFNTNTYLY